VNRTADFIVSSDDAARQKVPVTADPPPTRNPFPSLKRAVRDLREYESVNDGARRFADIVAPQ
jgi:hypothetical protein